MHHPVALNCLNCTKDLFRAHSRHYRAQQIRETENKTRSGEQANQKAKQMAI